MLRFPAWHTSVTAAILTLLGASSTPAAERPNIVLVVADDMGWSDLGCYGGEIPTPHLDALAAGGLRFRQFYNNAVCGPTRASILTGLQCQRVGHVGEGWNQPTDFTKCVTLGEVLRPAGYRTLMVGKWQERQLPAKLGFDRFFGPNVPGQDQLLQRGEAQPVLPGRDAVAGPRPRLLHDAVLTDHAVEFVREATGPRAGPPSRSSCTSLTWPRTGRSMRREAEIAPHRERYRPGLGQNPGSPPAAAAGSRPGPRRVDARPPAGGVHAWADEKFPEWQAERMAVYAAQIASIDRGVGRVLDVVRKAGATEKTLVMFVSDNGAAPDGGLVPSNFGMGFNADKPTNDWRLDGVPIRPGSGPDTIPGPGDTFAAYGLGWATVSNAPFRSTKTLAYEGGIRTPFIAHWPAVIARRPDDRPRRPRRGRDGHLFGRGGSELPDRLRRP